MKSLGRCKYPKGEIMSSWPFGTTADIGLRVFSSSPEGVLKEAVLGMQSILLSTTGFNLPWHHSQWNLGKDDWDRMLVKVLEETLYRAEIHNEWVVDISFSLGQQLHCQVAWVDASKVEREVEIKAITRHDLQVRELGAAEQVSSPYSEVPDIIGPGWIGDVVFDI
jgi:SHS2 domain-containing protein